MKRFLGRALSFRARPLAASGRSARGWRGIGPRHGLRKWAWGTLALCILCSAGWMLHRPILASVASFLVREHPLARPDLILLLGGDPYSRIPVAFALAQSHPESLLLVPESPRIPLLETIGLGSESGLTGKLLIACGLPAERIRLLPFPGGVKSTHDETLALTSWLEATAAGKETQVLLVTSALHSRRALRVFERIPLAGVVHFGLVAAPERGFEPHFWWKHENGWKRFFEEWVKTAYYWTRF